MKNWVLLTILYALIIGFYNCAKKKAVKQNSVYEVNAYLALISFFLTMLISNNVFLIDLRYLPIIFVKSLIIAGAWLTAAYLINKIPISLFAVLMLSKILFSVILSIIWLKEKITITTFIGMIIVITGLILVNHNKENNKKEISKKHLFIMLLSCLLSSISSVLDKKLLINMTSSQLQFWFLLFLTIILFIALLIKEKKITYKTVIKNYWILLMAISVVIADRFLFMAKEIPESKISIITIINQLSTIEIIILGKIMFKEKKIIKKLLCSLLIIIGIIFILLKI